MEAALAFAAVAAFAPKRRVEIKLLTWNQIEPAVACYKFTRWKNEGED